MVNLEALRSTAVVKTHKAAKLHKSYQRVEVDRGDDWAVYAWVPANEGRDTEAGNAKRERLKPAHPHPTVRSETTTDDTRPLIEEAMK